MFVDVQIKTQKQYYELLYCFDWIKKSFQMSVDN